MLSSLLKEHQIRQAERKEAQEKNRKAAIEACNNLTHSLVDRLNESVSLAYSNERKIDTEVKALQTNTAQFSRQTTQWLKLMEEFNNSLKELGDVENWSKAIEHDMNTITSALECVYQGMTQSGKPA